MPHLLIVDDDAETRDALAALVGAEGFSVAAAGSLREARIQLTRQQPDALLLDLSLPDGSGMDLVADVERHKGMQIILITGNASVETAGEALRIGATDYLVKPVNVARLRAVLSRIPRPADLQSEIGDLRSELRRLGRFGPMLGNAPAMQKLYDQILRVAPTEAPVLLVGESGTGKELAAQTVHELSRRRTKPFLGVNCGAISPSLIESEMFGHERGASNGADRQYKGYFERADGGTLFLDEITELPVELQVKLLRVLETNRFVRVGTDKEIEADVRVLAATNTDPEQAVRDGKLRADLYQRLNVFPLRLPPLRARDGDVPLLAQHFLDELNRSHGTRKTLSPQVLDDLAVHAWPGNVRELRNYMQRAFILADRTLDAAPTSEAMAAAIAAPTGPIVSIPVGTSLAEADKQLILATLEQCAGVKTQSAELLGISVKTLYNRLGEYGLQQKGLQQKGGLQGKATGAARGSSNGGTHTTEVPDANPGLSRH